MSTVKVTTHEIATKFLQILFEMLVLFDNNCKMHLISINKSASDTASVGVRCNHVGRMCIVAHLSFLFILDRMILHRFLVKSFYEKIDLCNHILSSNHRLFNCNQMFIKVVILIIVCVFGGWRFNCSHGVHVRFFFSPGVFAILKLYIT